MRRSIFSIIFYTKTKFPYISRRGITVTMPGTKRKSDGGSASSSESSKPNHEYWLIKSEPESRFEKGVDVKFGLNDLKNEPDQTACWDGVRNYQARNHMISMKTGQKALFYHSNVKAANGGPGVAGIVEIVKEAYVDHTQFDVKDPHYDPKSAKDNPKWKMVDVKFVRELKRFIPLSELKELHIDHKSSGGPLAKVALFTSARLSVQPLTLEEFEYILSLEKNED